MFKVFNIRAKVSFTRPIQTFKFDFNLKVIELFKLESNSKKFDSNLKKCMAGYGSYFSQYNIQQDFYLIK
jgi:hypothetical protein